MKNFIFISIGLLLFTACGSNDSSSNSESEGSPELISGEILDITNAILTETSNLCEDHIGSYSSSVQDIGSGQSLNGLFTLETSGSNCLITTNSIPNHDVNDGTGFVNPVGEVNNTFTITGAPAEEALSTSLSLTVDNGIFLNGAKLDILAAACYGVGPDPLGQEKIGCNDINSPWRYDPMSPLNNFGTDSHNAHTQPDGTYHYHGNPEALFNDSDESPVIGFAADGFPIYGSYINDNGIIRSVVSGYTLKSGSRVSQAGEGAFPGGSYDGTYRDDYEFTNAGDLDECNGMIRNGSYGYYVTDSFPWVLNCFKGLPDASFQK